MAAAYATLSDLYALGVPASVISTVSVPTQQAKLDAANAKVESYLNTKFRLPLGSWGADLREASAVIAAYECVVERGFDPEHAGDKVLKDRAEAAIKWLEGISNGDIIPVVTEGPPTVSGKSYVRQPVINQVTGSFTTSRATGRGW